VYVAPPLVERDPWIVRLIDLLLTPTDGWVELSESADEDSNNDSNIESPAIEPSVLSQPQSSSPTDADQLEEDEPVDAGIWK
jgi:hypothetical protein